MNATVEDLRFTIIPKSDQLNAEQLLGGPMTVTVTEVQIGGGEEQPVVVHYANEGGRPFKPCKTMRKVLIHAWGPNGRKWTGKSMTLYNDPSVKWGGEDVGGIRISHMSDIPHDIKVSLTTTRGKKAKYEVKRLTSEIAGQLAEITGSPTVEALKDTFAAAYKATKEAGLRAQLKAAYDARLAALSAPPPAADAPADDAPASDAPAAAAKTLADFISDIDHAETIEAASAALDAARPHLNDADHAELVEQFNRAWKE